MGWVGGSLWGLPSLPYNHIISFKTIPHVRFAPFVLPQNMGFCMRPLNIGWVRMISPSECSTLSSAIHSWFSYEKHPFSLGIDNCHVSLPESNQESVESVGVGSRIPWVLTCMGAPIAPRHWSGQTKCPQRPPPAPQPPPKKLWLDQSRRWRVIEVDNQTAQSLSLSWNPNQRNGFPMVFLCVFVFQDFSIGHDGTGPSRRVPRWPFQRHAAVPKMPPRWPKTRMRPVWQTLGGLNHWSIHINPPKATYFDARNIVKHCETLSPKRLILVE